MNDEMRELISSYTMEIEQLRTKLLESEATRATENKSGRSSSRLSTAMNRCLWVGWYNMTNNQ